MSDEAEVAEADLDPLHRPPEVAAFEEADVMVPEPVLVTIELLPTITVGPDVWPASDPVAVARFEIPGEVAGAEADAVKAYVADQVNKAVPHLSALINQNPSGLEVHVTAAIDHHAELATP